MSKMLRPIMRQLTNITKFMSSGKGYKSDKCDSDYLKKCLEKSSPSLPVTQENFCDNDNSCRNQIKPLKSKICKTGPQFPVAAKTIIDLSNPCGNPCKPSESCPEEYLVCHEIKFCSPTEENKARAKMWQIASFCVIPLVGLAMALIIPANKKLQELREEEIQNSEYIPYGYMHRITKPYWWGDGHHGLFFNPKVNQVPKEFEQTDNRNGTQNDDGKINENED